MKQVLGNSPLQKCFPGTGRATYLNTNQRIDGFIIEYKRLIFNGRILLISMDSITIVYEPMSISICRCQKQPQVRELSGLVSKHEARQPGFIRGLLGLESRNEVGFNRYAGLGSRANREVRGSGSRSSSFAVQPAV